MLTVDSWYESYAEHLESSFFFLRLTLLDSRTGYGGNNERRTFNATTNTYGGSGAGGMLPQLWQWS